MGSRIMHLIIGNQIAERLNIADKTSFLLGSVAPDAVGTKDESHFYRGEHRDFTRHIDYKEFLEKYKSHSDNLYVLGYFAHLIADEQWMKGFYMPWLRNRMVADPEVTRLYHNDFRLLNGKLLEHYDMTNDMKKAIKGKSNEVIDLEEVKSSDVFEFVPHVLGDMDYEEQVVDEPLNVFSFIQIQGYIETSVDVGIMNLQSTMAKNVHLEAKG
ncbi:zinc dependent phospholipase C family protein [Saccharibacillus alkalitolerans]|uniref:Zinc dependent phospholipase C family protein n=1 Tax=Saccharibacillus alkalitolerans TaxID=2705290 RepID=A0ABX0FCI6_9BACL|nr:zinc dependent phospholipase C family protein [Saccharibacillus alkalitolerans]NGZ77694.1 zinc dependent phospholipase C family protein [Saccharibacillus alkalitolerans]